MQAGKENDQEKNEIKLNRKMRMWHKYRNYAVGGVSIIVVVLICVAVIKNIGSGSADTAQEQTTAVQLTQQTAADTKQGSDQASGDETQSPSQETSQEQVTTEPAAGASVYKIEGTPEGQDFTSKDYYNGSVFFGDSIVDGISYYGYLSNANVIADGNITIEKAKDRVATVAAANPSKVFVMLGLNDVNFGTKSSDRIVNGLFELSDKIKESVPSAQVYIISIMPVTSDFEARTKTNIKQTAIDEVNQKLQEQAASKQVGFIDAASAFKDGMGYLSTTYTGNGTNLYNRYYPFLLNGIAEAVK